MTDKTTSEVAEILGVSRPTVDKMVKRGAFPNSYPKDPTNPSSWIMIPDEDVLAILVMRKGNGNE